jgi:hypothetical protein
MLTTYKKCPQQFLRQYMQHWAPTEKSVHLIAGGAFAAGIEAIRRAIFAEKKPLELALHAGMIAAIDHYGEYTPPEKSNKTLPNVILALEDYFLYYGTTDDAIQPYMLATGEPAVEFSFALPIGIKHPQTNEDILYVGRFDMLGTMRKALFVVDEKTTEKLGPSWLNAWNLRSQFTGYCWAALEHGMPVVGAIARGISFLKRDFGHAEVITYRPPHAISRWLETTRAYITDMIRDWENDTWRFNLDDSCTSYGGCPFNIICDKRTPEKWIENNFVPSEWRPVRGLEDMK